MDHTKQAGHPDIVARRLLALSIALVIGSAHAAAQAGAPGGSLPALEKAGALISVVVSRNTQEYDAKRDNAALERIVTLQDIGKLRDTLTLDMLKRVLGMTGRGTYHGRLPDAAPRRASASTTTQLAPPSCRCSTTFRSVLM